MFESTLIEIVSGPWWLWHGIAHGLVVYLILHLLLANYKDHEHLYAVRDASRTLDIWVKAFLPIARKIGWKKYREWLELSLSRAGFLSNVTSDYFISKQIVYFMTVFACSYLFMNLLLGNDIWLSVTIAFISGILPALSLKDRAEKRYRSCNKDLPFYVDYLTLSIEAGLDFNQGMEVVIKDAPSSPLKEEFSMVLRNMNLGMSREEALEVMLGRLNSPSLNLFVSNLVQSMRMGSEIVNTLNVLSESLRNRRFQMAEEEAGKISVRMMVPMMVFVMPATVIILLGPMMLQWLSVTG